MAYSRLACLGVLLGLVGSVSAMEWKTCDNGAFTPDKVTLSPDPPVIGQDLNFDIIGEYKKDVTIPSGALSVNVDYMGTAIFQTEWDLCKRTSCPINPGALNIHYQQTLPPIAPPGQYEVKLVATSSSGDELLCLLIDFSIAPAWKFGRKALEADA